jgi:hypothetical protein
VVKTHYLTLTVKTRTLASTRAKGFRAGLSRGRRWYKEIWTRKGLQRDHANAVVQVDRVVDRQNNRYGEKVVVVETGEVIRDVDEPLSEHRRSATTHEAPIGRRLRLRPRNFELRLEVTVATTARDKLPS